MGENVRVPLYSDLSIKEFSGSTITKSASKMVNCSLQKKFAGGKEVVYVTQRPAISLLHDASATVSDTKGRGIYYWDNNSTEYFINDDTVYRDSYSTTVGNISSGTRKCTMVECGSYLVILDAENNEAWTIASDHTLAQITDADFPSTLADGGAQLDGYLFIMDETGIIYHSDSDDPTAWNALDFIDAERENDGGKYLTKITDQIVAMGDQTIEFFYDNANATGSVLNRRADVHYNVGCIDGETVWRNNDFAYFLGVDNRGTIGVYTLQGFELKKVSKSDLDSYLTELRFSDELKFVCTGFSSNGGNYYAITVYYTAAGEITPAITIILEESSAMWHLWETNLSTLDGIAGLPIIEWTTRSGTSDRYGEGILSNGDIITFLSQPNAFDSSGGGGGYVVDDYVVDDYVVGASSGSDAIVMLIRLGELDFGTQDNKFMRNLEIVGPHTYSDQNITIRWSDGSTESYGSDRVLDLDGRRKLSALGKFNRRHFEFAVTSAEPVWLEAVEFNIDGGFH